LSVQEIDSKAYAPLIFTQIIWHDWALNQGQGIESSLTKAAASSDLLYKLNNLE